MKCAGRLLCLGLLCTAWPPPAVAQSTAQARVQAPARANEPRTHVTASRAARPPLLDGKLTDEVWASAEPTTGFLQTDPDEGKVATEDTEVRVLYDDQAIYMARECSTGIRRRSRGACRRATATRTPTG